MRPYLFLLISTGMALGAGAAPSLQFEPNQGQAPETVRFLTRGAGYTVFLEEDGSAVHVLLRGSDRGAECVRMRLLDAQQPAAVQGEERLSSVTRFYSGSDPERWHPEIPHYAHVRFQRVYPGIDLIWRGEAGELEYRFLLDAGADAARIRLEFEGGRKTSVDAQGNLLVETGGRTLRYQSPRAWQESSKGKDPVGISYYLNGDVVGFQMEAYDHTLPVVIDPVLSFSSYLGGAGYDAGYGITSDAAGNIYVTGETASSDFLLPSGAAKTARLNRDVFITKLSANGASLVYTTILASNGNDAGRAVAVDASGNIYVAGVAGSGNFPVTGGSFRRTSGGAEDAFVAKLNSSGKLTYSTFLGGSGTDSANGIAVDTSGNAYVTGYTASLNFPVTPGVPQTTYKGGFYDAFVTKLNSAGTALIYSTLLGGSGNDQGRAIALGPGNTACIAGRTDSVDLPLRNALQSAAGGNGDALVGCLNASGTVWNYLTYLGGLSADEAYALAVDSAGSAYVTGTTFSPNYPTTTAAFQTMKTHDYDAFVTKLSPSGNTQVYSTLLGASGTDSATTIAVDSSGCAWIAGYTSSVDFPQQSPTQPGYRGSFDAFVAQFSADGARLLTSTYLGGSADDRAWSLALGPTGDIFLTGATNSIDFQRVSALQAGVPAGYNAFVARLYNNSSPSAISISPSSGTGTSQTFTATLQDPNGATDITLVYLLINATSASLSNTCFIQYYRPLNQLILANDAGTGSTVLTPGTGTASNSQCTLNGSTSSVTLSGNTLTLRLALTISANFSGTKNLYLAGIDNGNLNTGWQLLGTWTTSTVPNQAPSIVSVSPSSGNGLSQTFTATISDPNGAGDVALVYFVVNSTTASLAGTCFVQYYRPLNQFSLFTDAGTGGTALTPGAGTATNSQCTLNASASSVSLTGNTLTLRLALSFSGSFSGTKNVYLAAIDGGNLNTGWQTAGTWAVTTIPNQPPIVLSITPSAGRGLSQTFTATFSDTNGASDISLIYFLVSGNSPSLPNACFVQYYRPLNQLFLANNAGTASVVLTPGSGTAANSQCTLNGATSSITLSGNTLTVRLSFSFASSFAGSKTIYLAAIDGGNLNSGWQGIGVWTVQ